MISSGGGGGDSNAPGGMSAWRARLEAMEGTIRNLEGILGTHRGSASGQFGPARNYDFNTGRREAERGPGGRFVAPYQGQLNIGGVTATIQQRYFREMHQMAMDIHSLVRGPRPAQPTLNLAAYTPTTAAAYNYTPYLRRGGGGSVPPSGTFGNLPPQFGPWGPRRPMGPPPGGGGGGGFGGGGGGGGGFTAAGGGGGALNAFMRGHGVLRGLLVGEIAGEIGGSIIKDFANPSRIIREMYQNLLEGTNEYTGIAKGYYSAGAAGRFSGAELTRRLLPMRKNEGDINPPDWMLKYGITNEEIQKNAAGFGIAPQSVEDYISIAQNLAINTRKPGFAGLNPMQPIGMARQAAALGMETTTGAADSYLRKLEEAGARWTLEGVDRARVFQNMQASLETISKTGATGIAGDSIRNLFDKLVSSGLPGGRTGDLAANMIAGATGFNNALGSDANKTALLGLALQKQGGWNAESVKKLLGPEVMQSIGGEDSPQFKQITAALTGGDWPGAAALIGNALNNDSTRINQVLEPLLRGMGIPAGSTAAIIRNQTGRPLSDTMGLPGVGIGANATMPWENASKLIQQFESHGGKNEKNPASSASGPWQMLDSTWADIAPTVGIDLNKYPTAMSAPIELQERAAHALYNKRGFQPWTIGNAKLAAHLASMGGGAAPSGVSGSLHAAMMYASSSLPPGYTARLTSGLRKGDSGQHGLGRAEDWEIIGPNGPISNRGKDTTGLYRRMAVAANVYALSHGGKPIVWGGHFGTEKGGGGEDDIMHFDEGDIRGVRGDNMSEINEAKRLIASGTAGSFNGPTDPNDITPKTEIGEGGIQIPPGAAIAPHREAAGASEGARNLELFGDAVPKLVRGLNDIDGALKKFENSLLDAVKKIGGAVITSGQPTTGG